MKTQLLIVLILSALVFTTGCNKEDSDSWAYCDGCPLEAWVGEYEGTGEFYDNNTEEYTTNIPSTISIVNTSDNILKIEVLGEDYYSRSFSKIKDDDNYSLDVLGSTASLSLSLSQKSDAYKISGNIKQYHSKKDSVIIDYSFSFEAFKDK